MIAIPSQRNCLLVAFLVALGLHLFFLFALGRSFYQLPEANIQQGNSNLEVGLVDAIPVENSLPPPSVEQKKEISQNKSELLSLKKSSEVLTEHKEELKKRSSAASENKMLGALHAKPSYLHNPQPTYPETERLSGHEGVVLLRVIVSSQGKVLQTRIQRSSGYPMLDERAVDTVLHSWSFRPAMVNNKEVGAEVLIPIHFSLAH